MQSVTTYRRLLCLLIFLYISLPAQSIPPRVCLIIVIDQLSQRQIAQHHRHFKYGLKWLLKRAVHFTNAHHPHGMPATAVGHTCLATGTLPEIHGIVGNYWYDEANTKITCDNDCIEDAAVFMHDGSSTDYGRSSRQILVDSLCDNYMIWPHTPQKPYSAISLSIKSRAAIAMGGKKAVTSWFDEQNGYFTTSKAYFETFPDWLTDFNTRYCKPTLKSLPWNTCYELTADAYTYPDVFNYAYAGYGKSIITNNYGQYQALPASKSLRDDEQNYKKFAHSPASSTLLTQLAKACISRTLNDCNDHHLLLWVSFSNLDKIGHVYGPDSLESLDTLYHLDRDVGHLITHIRKYVTDDELCIALTSDHGIMPIPELLAARGYPAKRINTPTIIETVNNKITQKYGIENILTHFKTPYFYANEKLLKRLDPTQAHAVIKDTKNLLAITPGIKKCWDYDELASACNLDPFAQNFKTQLYKNRSGRFICQTEPYKQLTRWQTGTGHRSCYSYDTHVPLLLYRKGMLAKKIIRKKIVTTQFAPTIADILHIPRPSACTTETLLPLI